MDSPYGQLLLSQAQGRASMLAKPVSNRTSFISPRTSAFASRPLSEATEIMDTDFEVDSSEPENSSNSGNSFGNDSSTTLSSPDGVKTPSLYESGAADLSWDYRKSVQGPTGPHLFRSSIESSIADKIDALEWDFPMSPVNLNDVRRLSPTQARQHKRRASDVQSCSKRDSIEQSSNHNEAEIRSWTPTQVAEWMYENGVEDSIVGRFIDNDISGSVLLDLQIDDLKELNIQSFGKRHHLMGLIQGLSDSLPSSPEAPSPPSRKPSRTNSRRSTRSKEQSASKLSPSNNNASVINPTRRGRRNRDHGDMISPAESVSIVAIEQLLPKPHKCSKGEDCPKYRRRQRQIAKIAKEFPNEFIQVTGDRVTTTVSEMTKAEQFYRPKSSNSPSIVASSDVLGPSQNQALKLSAETLNEVQPRDPQENVRQFLGFQHMNSPRLQTEQNPLALFPPLNPFESSPTSNRTGNLKDLPRLTIPENTPVDPSQRTITPSLGSRDMGSPTAIQEYNPYFQSMEMYRQTTTPFSEMDVPMTAFPLDPLTRETSQSVPPHMTFGNQQQQFGDPISRSQSAHPDARRRPSFTTMERLEEGKVLSPINDPSDMMSPSGFARYRRGTVASIAVSPTLGDSRKDSASHSGYMKKRRTRLLRHEWQDAHFTLKGTVLAMHKDEQDAQRSSRALETIDVDDYAVACSSLASSSKLTAAFKKSLLKRAANLSSGSVKGLDETAFAFSLIPATEKAEKKLFSSTGKSHHFAVKSRDDRINWMRELMLAKALKKGKDDGDEMQMNGNMI